MDSRSPIGVEDKLRGNDKEKGHKKFGVGKAGIRANGMKMSAVDKEILIRDFTRRRRN